MLYLSPLHVAVVHNRPSIIWYLSGAFPETLTVTDRLGRTPLHYAAINPKGKRVYNTLVALGADKTVQDKVSATKTLRSPSVLPLVQELKNCVSITLNREMLPKE
jgi:ankyrin repeat protein